MPPDPPPGIPLVQSDHLSVIRTGRQAIVEELDHAGEVSWFVRCRAPVDSGLNRAFALQGVAIEYWRAIESWLTEHGGPPQPDPPGGGEAEGPDFAAVLAIVEGAVILARQRSKPGEAETGDDEALLILQELRKAGWSITRTSN